MIKAYSCLQSILEERALTVPELGRRLAERGLAVNLKSLYRLKDAHEPLRRLDLTVAGAICEVCDVDLGALVSFDRLGGRLKRLSRAKQDRLDELMDANNEGRLRKAEKQELQALVEETQQITLHNARLLVAQKQKVQEAKS